MKFTIGILFTLSMIFNPVLSQANDVFDNDENLSFPSQEEEYYDPQQILESLEALAEDLANAERTENGYRILLSGTSATTLGALTDGARASGSAGNGPTGPDAPRKPGNPADDVSLRSGPANGPGGETRVVGQGAAAARTPTPSPSVAARPAAPPPPITPAPPVHPTVPARPSVSAAVVPPPAPAGAAPAGGTGGGTCDSYRWSSSLEKCYL